MSPRSTSGQSAPAVPRFYVTPNQRVSPAIILLAVLIALGCVPPLLYALRHTRHIKSMTSGSGAVPLASSGAGTSGEDNSDDPDDPSQVDTIYLGDPSDAPVAARPSNHVNTVHPFIVVQLPRSGEQSGQIPSSPAGHLLYDWLAAFNSTDPSESAKALSSNTVGVAEAEEQLRRETGGFTLLSAKEVQPGVIVFRLHDQTTSATEVLGTLQVRPGSKPATIANFCLRALSSQPPKHP